jgi:hypothetical protein
MFLYQNCGGFKSAEDGASVSSSSFGSVSFKCSDDSLASTSKSLMLSKLQLSNAIEDLFGASVLNAVSNELSSLSEPVNNQDTNERLSLIGASDGDSYMAIAYAVATQVVNNKARREAVFGACSSLASPAVNCIDGFINNFAKRILRRPLSLSESSFTKNLANSGGSYITNLEAILAYHLQSPYFLWRLELGEGGTHTPEKTYITQYEIATRIALAATDSIPDQILLMAAEQGQLNSMSVIRSQTQRLINTKRGQDKVIRMMSWWSLANRPSDIANLPADLASSLNLNGLTNAMSDEANLFIKDIIYNSGGSFSDLLTSKKSFASHDGLASIYGHAPVTDGQPVQITERRQGLLMRASFFTHDTPRTSIIHRGVDFQKRFLCKTIPSPNVDIVGERDADALTHDELLNTSNREAIAHQTKSPVCMGCHSVINPTGFAFENFDSFGRLRQVEEVYDQGLFVRNIAINTATSVPFPGNTLLEVQDAYDLISGVAHSSAGTACIAKTAYRYINEKMETESDNCELKRAQDFFGNEDKPILDALIEIIANEHIGEKVH